MDENMVETPAEAIQIERVEPLAGRWLVWGDADPIPETFFDEEPAAEDGVAWLRHTDPEWAVDAGGWAVILSATPEEIDDWARAAGSVRGFVPYPPDALPAPHPAGEEHAKVERARPY